MWQYTFLNVAAPNVFISDDVPTSYPFSVPTIPSLGPAEPAGPPIHEDDGQVR